jgi:hypothetical protein
MENEILGYLASAIVLLSYMQRSTVWLRIFGSIGCLMFIGYALLKNDLPVVIVNAAIVLINAVFIYKAHKRNVENESKNKTYDLRN